MRILRSSIKPSLACALLILCALGTCASNVSAQWTGGGIRVFAQAQAVRSPHLAADGSGGVLVGCIGDLDGLAHVARLDALGRRVWSDDAASLADATVGLGLFADGLGGAFMACGVRGIDQVAAGGVVMSDLDLSGSFGMSIGVTAADGAGGMLYASSYRSAMGHGVFSIGHLGAASWGTSILDFDANRSAPRVLAVAPDATGGAYTLVQSDPLVLSPPPYGTLARWTAAGAAAGWPAGGRTQWTNATAQEVRLVPVSTSGDSGVFVLWQDAGQRIFAQRVRPDGSAQASSVFALQILDGTDFTAIVNAVPCQGGGLLVGLVDYGPDMTGAATARFLAVDSSSTVRSEFVISAAGVSCALLSLIGDGAGGAYAVWSSGIQGHVELHALRFNGDGSVAPGWPAEGALIRGGAGDRYQADAVVSGGKLIVAWEEGPGEPLEIEAAQVAPDGTVPTRLGFESATFTGDRVHLQWRGDAGPQAAVVQRSSDGASWDVLGTTDRDGLGRYPFDDNAPAPGTRVAYRLASAALTPLTDMAWVDAPSATHLALRGFVAGASKPTLALTLASAAPATLRLYDVQGRVAATQTVAGAAGAQQVTLENSLRTGVYMARLAQDGISVTRRVVLLR